MKQRLDQPPGDSSSRRLHGPRGEDLFAERSWLRRKARRLLGRRTRTGLDSEDLTQQAQLEAWRARDRLRFEGRGALRAWLGIVVANLARQAGRRRSADGATASTWERMQGSASTPSERAGRREETERMTARLARLPERSRRVVELRLWEDLGFEEVGERVGISAGNARVTFHRAMTCLRDGEHPEFEA